MQVALKAAPQDPVVLSGVTDDLCMMPEDTFQHSAALVVCTPSLHRLMCWAPRHKVFLQAELAQQHAEEAKLHAEEAAEAASPSKAPAEAEHGAPAPPAHAAVESVHEQLAASQQRLQSVEAGLQGLHRQLADQQAKLGALQGHPKLLEKSSEPLQQQLAQQQAAIVALQESAGPQRAMEALQKQATQQQAELAELQEAVAAASLPELQRQLLAAQEQLRGLQQQSDSLSSSHAQAGLPEEVEVRINKVELTVAGEKMCASFAAVAAHLIPSISLRADLACMGLKRAR